MSLRNLNPVSKDKLFVLSIFACVLSAIAIAVTGIAWQRSNAMYAELESLRAEHLLLKAEANNVWQNANSNHAQSKNNPPSTESLSSTEEEIEQPLVDASNDAAVQDALKRLNYHLQTGTSECLVDERSLILEDVHPGALILSLEIKNVSACNRSDLLVISPKPHNNYPHNPPGILTAKYVDPASSIQIDEVVYEVIWTGFRYDLYATVRTYGPSPSNTAVRVHWLSLPVR